MIVESVGREEFFGLALCLPNQGNDIYIESGETEKSIHGKTSFDGMNRRDSIIIRTPICQTGNSDRQAFHYRNYLLELGKEPSNYFC